MARHGTDPDMRHTLADRARLRNVLAARPADAHLDLEEAAVWTGLAPLTLRRAAQRGELRVAGRGARRTPLFSRAELDRFLAARAGHGVDDRPPEAT